MPRSRTMMAAAALLCCAHAAAGQQPAPPARPYSTITVEVAGMRQPRTGNLAAYWDDRTGVSLGVHTPFHLGEVGIAARTARFESRAAGIPSFRSYMLGVDWRFTLPGTAWVQPDVSATAGDFLTIYDGEQAKGAGKESEIFIGAAAGLRLRATRDTRVRAMVTVMQVLTSTPIRLVQATLGASHTLATPGWLMRVIE